jgi:hypothetical protein
MVMKPADPHKISLLDGNAHFGHDDEYTEYLKSIPPKTTKEEVGMEYITRASLTHSRQKTTCNYLNAANNQDRKKFKNMAITGTINVQCAHIFILATVDLQLGERSSFSYLLES